MRRLLILFLLISTALSCGRSNKPDGLLSEDQMVSVLIDIHLTEGVASALPIPYDSSQTLYRLLEKDIFLKHDTSDSVFTESMRYYLQYPERMDQMYARVIDSLVVRESNPTSEEKM
ncbi:DUF4296 domain-containing protein [Algoriphagus algorifonticola]|uniref:DUF4296 domain-containing protein n=1 Tax=Algoriphagus algorifonticola TaxID=2593007 RepID=UPI0011A4B2E1|nr:DUF4296 domain-containing protein [Algoriphagus algorifonticola]